MASRLPLERVAPFRMKGRRDIFAASARAAWSSSTSPLCVDALPTIECGNPTVWDRDADTIFGHALPHDRCDRNLVAGLDALRHATIREEILRNCWLPLSSALKT